MIKEPNDKYFGTPMSEWIDRIPNELQIDAVGLWQIIPVGIDSFGLSGENLEDFTYRCIVNLLQHGAIPVKAMLGVPGWIPEKKYQGNPQEIAKKIICDWIDGKIIPDHDGLWFSIFV